MFHPHTKFLAATALALTLPGAASALVLDTFETQQKTADAEFQPPPNSESQVEANEAIGSYRDIDAVNDTGALQGTQAGVNGDGLGHFNLSNGAGTSGSAYITYDGNDDDATMDGVDEYGLGGVDLTGGNYFAFDVISADFSFDYELEVWDGDSSDSVSGVIAAMTRDATETIDFSSFTGIDFTNVGAVQLSFSGGDNSDLAIDNFRTSEVPLPASLPLLMAGVGGFAMLRRKKKS